MAATKKYRSEHSCTDLLWRVGQAVKTWPFQGCNTGSIPVLVTILADVLSVKSDESSCDK